MVETVKDFYLDKNIKISKEEHFNVLTNLVNNKPGEYTKLVDRLTIQNYKLFKDKPRKRSTGNNVIIFIKTLKTQGDNVDAKLAELVRSIELNPSNVSDVLTEYELERSSFVLEFEHTYSKLMQSLDSHVNKSHYVLEKILEQLVNNSIRTMYPIDSIVDTKSKDSSILYQEFLNHFVKTDDITTFETATDLVIKQLNRDIKAARTITDLERLFYTIESIDKLVSYTPLIHDLLRELSHAIYTFRPKQNVENKLKLSSIFG